VLARLPLKLRNLIQIAPDEVRSATVPVLTPAVGGLRLRVGLVTGCVQRVFFGEVNRATTRVLAAEGCEVHTPAAQGCCGALALHAGRDDEARAFARALIAAFEAPRSTSAISAGSALIVDQIVVNAAGCGSTMKMYGELLKDDPAWAARAHACSAKVRDVSETLAGLAPFRAPRRRLDLRAAYHDACHLAHAQRIRREPRALLESIPGISIVPLAEPDICCGSAGIFNLVEPEMAMTLGRRKADHVADAGPDVVVTSNPGCILQIRAALRAAGNDTPVVHLVELLDRAVTSEGSG
jgi:glycolate oxidase iron-sulfur subunit